MTVTNESWDHIAPFILSFFPWRSIVTPFSSWQTFSVFAASVCLTELAGDKRFSRLGYVHRTSLFIQITASNMESPMFI